MITSKWEAIEEAVIEEMNHRCALPRLHEDNLPHDDTQVGIEFAFALLRDRFSTEAIALLLEEASLKRYSPDTEGTYGLMSAVMREEPDGDYVKYTDFIAQGRMDKKAVPDLTFLHTMSSEELDVVISQLTKEQIATLRRFLHIVSPSLSAQDECPGRDDPEERCPRHPDDCTCWQVDLDKAKSISSEIEALRVENGEFRQALKKIANFTARCEHDGGFDREIGPIGCDLGDKCVCIGVHPIASRALQTGSFSFRDEAEVLPQDIINLVITAREAFDTGMLPDDESHALDKALEAFSSRVPYENEPGAALQQQGEGK
jgi:hypothetical protein